MSVNNLMLLLLYFKSMHRFARFNQHHFYGRNSTFIPPTLPDTCSANLHYLCMFQCNEHFKRIVLNVTTTQFSTLVHVFHSWYFLGSVIQATIALVILYAILFSAFVIIKVQLSSLQLARLVHLRFRLLQRQYLLQPFRQHWQSHIAHNYKFNVQWTLYNQWTLTGSCNFR